MPRTAYKLVWKPLPSISSLSILGIPTDKQIILRGKKEDEGQEERCFLIHKINNNIDTDY